MTVKTLRVGTKVPSTGKLGWVPGSVRAATFLLAALATGPGASAHPLPQDAALQEDDFEARARRLDEQEAQVEALRAQLQALLDQAAAVEEGAPPVGEPGGDKEVIRPDAGIGRGEEFTDADFLKSVPLFGSDWRFSFGGYAKVDLLHDFAGTGDESQFTLSTIPIDGSPPPGSYTNLQAKETRFNFEVRDTGGEERSRFFLELDFFQPSPSPRLRHAYFEHGNLLAGRTWTTLTVLQGLPFLLDFAGGDSLYGGRTEQIRWQVKANENWSWAVALEAYEDGIVYNADDQAGVSRSNLPRFIGRTNYTFDKGLIAVGASVNQNRWDGTDGVSDATATAWSVMTGMRIYVDSDNQDFVGFGASYGEGTTDTIISLLEAAVPSAVLGPDGELENVPAWNATIGLHKAWSSEWSSNLSLAYAELDDVPGLPADTMRESGSVHVNLIRSFGTRMTAGLEYMHGTQELVSGADGTASRVQFSLIYYF